MIIYTSKKMYKVMREKIFRGKLNFWFMFFPYSSKLFSLKLIWILKQPNISLYTQPSVDQLYIYRILQVLRRNLIFKPF